MSDRKYRKSAWFRWARARVFIITWAIVIAVPCLLLTILTWAADRIADASNSATRYLLGVLDHARKIESVRKLRRYEGGR